MKRTRERVRDFLEMGVMEVWVLHPEARTVTVCTGATTGEYTTGILNVPETPIVLDIAGIFQVLDEYE